MVKIILISILVTILIIYGLEFIRVDFIYRKYKKILIPILQHEMICMIGRVDPILRIEDIHFKIYKFDISNWGRDLVDWKKFKAVKQYNSKYILK